MLIKATEFEDSEIQRLRDKYFHPESESEEKIE